MAAYYNEIDAYAAEWLRNLIKAGHIADGEVDTRSIVDVQPDELREFTQCHFFAGIAGWSHALRLAGWEDERQIWTGSCPCQPFSVAGQGKGVNDERHLWPHFFRLIRGCRPPVVMGEQVAGAAGYGWLDGVRSDLESESYTIEGVDIPACSVNAPHIRQRLYWVASNLENTIGNGCQQWGNTEGAKIQGECSKRRGELATTRNDGELPGRVEGFCGSSLPGSINMAHTKHTRRDAERLCGHGEAGQSMGERQASSVVRSGEDGAQDMADTKSIGRGRWTDNEDGWRRQLASSNSCEGSGLADTSVERRQQISRSAFANEEEDGRKRRNWSEQDGDNFASSNGESNFWDGAIWLNGADGKTRRAQPDICLLAHGVPARVGKLRAYGNAIVPPLAAEVIKAFMEKS